jgi:uncharacterized protein YcaQ
MAAASPERLRAAAVCHALFRPTTLKAAVGRMGFVQADPIRSPARAQDLILRHRVRNYRAGDLEKRYASLDIEEDYLYAYGFLPRLAWQLLHPRNTTALSDFQSQVLQIVRQFGRMHPRQLDAHFGKERVINAWGGYSKATTRALEALHYRGHLRIARRDNGIRIYEAASLAAAAAEPLERVRKLILVVANIFAPVPLKSLQAKTSHFRRLVPGLASTRGLISDLIHAGELRKETIDGLDYVWPADVKWGKEAPRAVRFLAPFDPLVWDRRRFEHLWGWPYRFEAYTPPAKRLRGYYAMPMLWADQIIGWANASMERGQLNVEVGFVRKRPTDRDFRSELELEIGRLEQFLKSKP